MCRRCQDRQLRRPNALCQNIFEKLSAIVNIIILFTFPARVVDKQMSSQLKMLQLLI